MMDINRITQNGMDEATFYSSPLHRTAISAVFGKWTTLQPGENLEQNVDFAQYVRFDMALVHFVSKQPQSAPSLQDRK